MPIINAIIAVSADKSSQGAIYGINAAVSSTGHAIGPLIGSVVAMVSLRATFLATSLVLGIAVLEIMRRRKKLNIHSA